MYTAHDYAAPDFDFESVFGGSSTQPSPHARAHSGAHADADAGAGAHGPQSTRPGGAGTTTTEEAPQQKRRRKHRHRHGDPTSPDTASFDQRPPRARFSPYTQTDADGNIGTGGTTGTRAGAGTGSGAPAGTFHASVFAVSVGEEDDREPPRYYDLNTKVPGEAGAPEPTAARHHKYVCGLSNLATAAYLKAARIRRRRLRGELVAALRCTLGPEETTASSSLPSPSPSLPVHGYRPGDALGSRQLFPVYAKDTRGAPPPWMTVDTTLQPLEDSDPEFDRDFEFAPGVLATYASQVRCLQSEVYGDRGPPWAHPGPSSRGSQILASALENLTEDDLQAADMEAQGTAVWAGAHAAASAAAKAAMRPGLGPGLGPGSGPSLPMIGTGWVFASGPIPKPGPRIDAGTGTGAGAGAGAGAGTCAKLEAPLLTLASAGKMRAALATAEAPFLKWFREKQALLQTTARALLWGPHTCVLCAVGHEDLPPPTGLLAREVARAAHVLHQLRALEKTVLNADSKWDIGNKLATAFNAEVVPFLTTEPSTVFAQVVALGTGRLLVTPEAAVAHLQHHGSPSVVAAAIQNNMAASFHRMFAAMESRLSTRGLRHTEDLKSLVATAKMVATLTTGTVTTLARDEGLAGLERTVSRPKSRKRGQDAMDPSTGSIHERGGGASGKGKPDYAPASRTPRGV